MGDCFKSCPHEGELVQVKEQNEGLKERIAELEAEVERLKFQIGTSSDENQRLREQIEQMERYGYYKKGLSKAPAPEGKDET